VAKTSTKEHLNKKTMKTMKTRNSILLSAAALLLAEPSAMAALVVIDGGFENSSVGAGDNSFSQSVVDWFDSSPNWSSFAYRNLSQLSTGSQVYASESDSGFIYQSLGTRSAGENTIVFNFDAIERDRSGYDWPGSITFDFYSGDFLAAADGTDIDASLTSFDTLTIAAGDIFSTPLLNTGTDRETVNHTTSSIDLTGVTVGDQVWVRIGTITGDGNKGFYIDNVAIIPEPSSAALIGVAGLALMLRRRR